VAEWSIAPVLKTGDGQPSVSSNLTASAKPFDPHGVHPRMDWFERITGFREQDHASTRDRLRLDGEWLVSAADGRRSAVGRLELCTLHTLRQRTPPAATASARTTVRCIVGDARALHADPALHGALFQVASQFNLLEMVSPEVSPEQGVTRYQHDRTQGPACAIAAGAATIYRNYLVPLDGGRGQTETRQIDALAPLGQALSRWLELPVAQLWTMRNGYALGRAAGLDAVGRLLAALSDADRDRLRGTLAIGLHSEVQVTDDAAPAMQRVSQAFCSALPVAYSRVPAPAWEPLARLVLEAAFEATLRAAAAQRQRGGSATVLLTRLGGGAFGNDERWIDDALARALQVVEFAGLDVWLVSHGTVHPSMRAIASRWG
jgi:hypothetical protein